MKIIIPVDITPDKLEFQPFQVMPDLDPLVVRPGEQYQVPSVSTNVPENDYPEWAAGTYEQGDRVIWGHRVYEVVAESTTDTPAEGVQKQPRTWLDVGPTNRWAMFDDKIGTVTSNPEVIEVALYLQSGVDSIAFFGVDAAQVSIRVTDPYRGITYEDINFPSSRENVQDWYGYFFDPIEIREDFVVSRLGATRSSVIRITLSKPGGDAKVGALVLGKTSDLGVAVYGTSVGIIDFSRKERDQFGNYNVVERGFSKRAEYDVAIETGAVARVQRLLAKNRAKPVVWIGEDSYESTIVYGYYRSFDISISGPSMSDATITVEGLN